MEKSDRGRNDSDRSVGANGRDAHAATREFQRKEKEKEEEEKEKYIGAFTRESREHSRGLRDAHNNISTHSIRIRRRKCNTG